MDVIIASCLTEQTNRQYRVGLSGLASNTYLPVILFIGELIPVPRELFQMKRKLLLGGWGGIQIGVGGVLIWSYLGHAVGVFGVAALGAVVVSGVLKVASGLVSTSVVNVQRATGGSFLLDGLLFVVGYQFLIETGVYEALIWAYALATLSALTMIGIGIGILRDRTAFPMFFPEQCK